MKFVLNPATTMEYDFETDIRAYHAAGITHLDLWFHKLEDYLKDHEMAQAKDLLKEHEITFVSTICIVRMMLSDIKTRPDDLHEFRDKLGICRELNCPMIILIPENPEKPQRAHYASISKNLRHAVEVAADEGVAIGLEFLQGNNLLSTLATGKQIVRDVAHPGLGLVIDLAHIWMGRSDPIDLNDLRPEEISVVHLDDMETMAPELLTDHDRTFPGLGRGIDHHLIPAIQATGYAGYWALEIFNRDLWAQPIDSIVAQSIKSFEYLQRRYETST